MCGFLQSHSRRVFWSGLNESVGYDHPDYNIFDMAHIGGLLLGRKVLWINDPFRTNEHGNCQRAFCGRCHRRRNRGIQQIHGSTRVRRIGLALGKT